jgi:cell division protein FtsQ
MAEKRKISVRKILQVFITLVVTTGCIVAMVSASRIEDTKTLTSVAVHIRNDKKYHFIEEKEIMDLVINNRKVDIAHTPVSKLDIHGMEQVILADPWVSDAQVYVDNDRVLHMYVTQRIPVARLFLQNNASCYIDTSLSLMPLSDNNIYYTTVVTNVPELRNDSMGRAISKQIVTLARNIQADSFWNAQISQVIVDSDITFEFVPVLGDQRILFGDITGMSEKFNNLFVFYKNVLNRIGWDKYETLDVRFSGQVVALPSLPYTGPVDVAVDKLKMNWITNMVETEAAKDVSDSLRAAEARAKNATAQKKKAEIKKVAKPIVQAKPVVKKATKAPAKVDKKTPVKTKPPVKNVKKKPDKKVAEKKAPDKKAPDRKATPKPVANDKGKVKQNTKDKEKKQQSPKFVYPETKVQ